MTKHIRKAQRYRDNAKALRSLAEGTVEKVQGDLYAVAAEYEVLAAEFEATTPQVLQGSGKPGASMTGGDASVD